MNQLVQAIRAAESIAASRAAHPFAARSRARERLEVHVFDRLRSLEEQGPLSPELLALERRARALDLRWAASNQRAAEGLRRQLFRMTPRALARAFVRHAGPRGEEGRFDALDELVAAVFDVGLPAAAERRLPKEMVAYQPTPARAVLDLIESAEIDRGDVVYDLGSGLGRTAMLIALWSGARVRGIELQRPLRDYAARSARRLGIRRVEFLQGDARKAPLDGGTVYYLFTPFRGAVLRRVLGRLRRQAEQRLIRVCTYGPCTALVSQEPWLSRVPRGRQSEHGLGIFRAF